MINISSDVNIVDNTNKINNSISLKTTENIFNNLVKVTLSSIEAYDKESDSYLIAVEHMLMDGEIFILFEENTPREKILAFDNGREKLLTFETSMVNEGQENNITNNSFSPNSSL